MPYNKQVMTKLLLFKNVDIFLFIVQYHLRRSHIPVLLFTRHLRALQTSHEFHSTEVDSTTSLLHAMMNFKPNKFSSRNRNNVRRCRELYYNWLNSHIGQNNISHLDTRAKSVLDISFLIIILYERHVGRPLLSRLIKQQY